MGDAQVWGGLDYGTRTKMFKHTIKTDLSMNWGTNTDSDHFRLYKFFPHADSTYHYVAECSNRGLCDADGIVNVSQDTVMITVMNKTLLQCNSNIRITLPADNLLQNTRLR